MSLEGTLETIALPDVLALLSVTAKTGELRIESGGGVGSVWLDAGRLSGFDVATHRTAVDSLFGLLRLQEGHFKFYTGTNPVNAVEPQDVAPLLEEAENRLEQWSGIAAAVPSMHSKLSLQESVEGVVTLRADQWQLVATIGGGQPVADVLNMRGLGEFDGCKAVKELVDLRLVHVDSSDVPPSQGILAPAGERSPEEISEQVSEHNVDHNSDHSPELAPDLVGASAAETVEWARDGEVPAQVDEPAELSEVWNDETGSAEVAPEEEPVEVVAAPTPEPVNRGLLLKFLGSARN